METQKNIKRKTCIMFRNDIKKIGTIKASTQRKSFSAYVSELILKDCVASQKEEDSICSTENCVV